MDPIDDLLSQLGEVDERKDTQTEIKEIDIFSIPCSENQKIVSPIKKDVGNENDSDDEELYIKKRELSEQGMQLESWLKKNSSTSGCNSTDSWKSIKGRKSILTGISNNDTLKTTICGIVKFDKFQISVRNPKVSSQNFGLFTAGMKLVKLSDLKPSTTMKDAWCTMCVIVEKGLTKKSGNGNEYLIWKIHDLKDCQSIPIKLLMFGDAIKEHWKLQLGTVIGLMSPQIAEDTKSQNKTITLKVSKSSNIVEIGLSLHFGTCKGTRQQDGQRCSNFVNTSLSEFCVYHVMSAARKLSANRGAFNAVTCGPNLGGLSVSKKSTPKPNSLGLTVVKAGTSSLGETMRPADSNAVAKPNSNLKTTTKEEEKGALAEILSKRKNTFAARQILKLQEKKEDNNSKLGEILEELGKEKEKREKHASFGDFLKADTENERSKTVDLCSKGASKIWASSAKRPMGQKDAQEHAARLRAIAILNKQRNESAKAGGVKRKATVLEEEPKKQKLNNKLEEIKKMLSRKSIHQAEAEKEENDRLQQHLTSMEDREKVETFTTTCMAVKNVKVVTCSDCKYTAQCASSTCIEKGHKLVKHESEKRFFKCAGCKRRTVCFELMPVKHCQNCNENKWIRVAMRDERKILLDTEHLLLRGEERTFVNS